MSPKSFNPCLSCGACCTLYRVSFYWAEAGDVLENGVPVEMTWQLTPFRRCMRTTTPDSNRCIALMGIVGGKVACSIYERRSSVCREFPPSWENGQPNERCDAARAHYKLIPVAPYEWDAPGNFPKAA